MYRQMLSLIARICEHGIDLNMGGERDAKEDSVTSGLHTWMTVDVLYWEWEHRIRPILCEDDREFECSMGHPNSGGTYILFTYMGLKCHRNLRKYTPVSNLLAKMALTFHSP